MSTTTASSPSSLHVLGDICWHELHTRDTQRAAAFYTALIGWTTAGANIPQYTEWVTASGAHVGGMMEMPAGVPAHIPAHWAIYINVADVDAAAQKAVTLGGRQLAPPMEIPNIGRMCPIADPTGATLNLFKGIGVNGAPSAASGVGQFCWTELLTSDRAKAKDFYTRLFGWTTTNMPMSTGEYTIFWHADAKPELKQGWAAGMMEIAPEWGAMPSCWLTYIHVQDVDQTAARISSLGGALCCPPSDIPGMGRFAIGTDPTGAMFALYMEKPAANA